MSVLVFEACLEMSATARSRISRSDGVTCWIVEPCRDYASPPRFAPLPGAAEDTSVEIRDTRYAKAPDGAYIAYQIAGEGPIDLVWQFDFMGNVDLAWEWPDYRGWLPGLAAFCRLILHDRRGTGLSSRNVSP